MMKIKEALIGATIISVALCMFGFMVTKEVVCLPLILVFIFPIFVLIVIFDVDSSL